MEDGKFPIHFAFVIENSMKQQLYVWKEERRDFSFLIKLFINFFTYMHVEI